jgi:hypothetical protein
MEASTSWGRDGIATVYRLRVVIATPRIELGGLAAGWVVIDATTSRPEVACRDRNAFKSPEHVGKTKSFCCGLEAAGF